MNYLSDLEKEMIKSYIEYNAFQSCKHYTIQTSIENILQPWEDAKKQYLFKLFGHNLILKKDITYKKDVTEMAKDLNDRMKGLKFCTNFRCRLSRWHNKYEHYTNKPELAPELDKDEYVGLGHTLSSLLYTDTLVENVYEGNTLNIPMPNGKFFKLEKGAKITRVLGKLAKAYSIEGWEEFRLAHSMVLNQKELKGELCISIHPLDYMTMSDNKSGWSSCMSWGNEGEFRQGTVEMLNSPNVVVAYLTAKEPMEFNRFNSVGVMTKYEWNNKKWRELFIVDKDVVTEIKPYPYVNNYLSRIVLDWLSELKNKTMDDWKPKYIEYEAGKYFDEDSYLEFSTCYMYNDFGSVTDVLGYVNTKNGRTKPKGRKHIVYSGPSECMCCGATDIDISRESKLTCDFCSTEEWYCECCDSYFEGEAYHVGDSVYCEYCYNEYIFTCPVTEEEMLSDETYIFANLKDYLVNSYEQIYVNPAIVSTRSLYPYLSGDKISYTFVCEDKHTKERSEINVIAVNDRVELPPDKEVIYSLRELEFNPYYRDLFDDDAKIYIAERWFSDRWVQNEWYKFCGKGKLLLDGENARDFIESRW